MRKSALILAILLFSCTDQPEKHSQKTGTKTVTVQEASQMPGNSSPSASRTIFVQQREAVNIIASLSGKPIAQNPALQPGDPVKKGQLLVQFDNTDLFLRLRAEKKSLRDDLLSIQPQVPATDSLAFSELITGMSPNGLLPPFPKLSLQSLQLLDSRQLLDKYDNIALEEAEMKHYFVFSPADGRIASVNPSESFKKGNVMLTIAPQGFTVSPPVEGRPGTKIELLDSAGMAVKAVITRQNARATHLSGKLKAGNYSLVRQ